MKKLSLILTLALMAFTATAWAQQTQVNVGNEQQLRTNLESLSECTINLMADIVLNSGNINVNYGKTLNMNEHTISVHPEVGVATRLFNVQTGAQFTISGTGNLSGHTITSDGGLIYLNQNATLTLSGATLSLNINGSVTNGGAIYNNGGTVNLLAATLTVSYAYGVDVNNGGIIYNAGTLAMNSGTTTLSGGHATNGGAIYVKSGQITAGGETTFSNNTATYGGAIYVLNGGTALCSADFSDNSATYGGAIYNNGTLTISGGNIGGIDETDPDNPVSQGNSATTSGGAIYNFAGTLNISGGSISYNSVENINGGGIFNLSGNINISGGSISNNSTSAKDGGGIHSEGGTIVMTGGSISNNTAHQNCGGVNLTNATTMTMSGGSIANNTAGNNDGGVYIGNGSTLTMTGGSITGNTATRADRGGGISVVGNLKMSGNPIVMGNLVIPASGTETTSNLYLPSGKKITVNGAFSTGASVGVTCAGGNGTTFTSGYGTYSHETAGVFSSDNTSLTVTIAGSGSSSEAKLVTYTPPGVPAGSIPYLNVDATGDHGTAYCSTYTKMSTLTDNGVTLSGSTTNGWYVVDQNLTFNKRITISGTVNLILMDNTGLTANKGIFVPSGATLHIWGQSNKTGDPNDLMGTINATANEEYYSGIGGYGGGFNQGENSGVLYFHGGFVCATGGQYSAGIHGYHNFGENYSVRVYGGNVIGIGGLYGAGIGGQFLGMCGSILITGGTVIGRGGYKGAGIGSGYAGKNHDMAGGYSGNPGYDGTIICITGGTVFGWGSTGAGIGGGEGKDTFDGDPATIYIKGGTVKAITDDGISISSYGGVAIGWGMHGVHYVGGDDYLEIYDDAIVLANTDIHGELTRQYAADGRNNYRQYKQMEIRPCDHPEHTPITYTDNGSSLSVNCDYCYTKEPYTFQSAGNWNDASKWLGNFTPGNGKNVAVKAAATIPSSCCAHVGNIDMQEGGSLTINDGGQLIHSNAGVTATVEKSIIGHSNGSNGGWNFVASPLTESFAPTAVNGFLTNTYDLYFYEESTHYWRNFKPGNQASGFSIEPQQGYLYANSGGTMLQFNGTLQPNTEVTIGNLSQSASTLTGFNLVGNPFAHNVTTYTGTNVSAECFRLNDARSEVVVGTIDAEHPLLPAEGFFVKATGADASITFNAQKRGTAVTPARISLELVEGSPSTGSGTALIDRLIVKREGEPLEKLTIRDGGTRLFALRDSQEMAVVIAEGNEQPVSFKAAQDGTYTLTVQVEGMELGYLHLIDNLTGNDVDLLQTPSYTFESNANDYASRFRLVFTADEDNLDNTDNFAFVSNGNIIIKGGPSTSSGTLQIVDVTGRIVATHSGRIQCVPTAGMASGVYVLRLIDGNSVRTQKMVIE